MDTSTSPDTPPKQVGVPLRNIQRRAGLAGGITVGCYEFLILAIAAIGITQGSSSAYSKAWVIAGLIFPLSASFFIAFYAGKIASHGRLLFSGTVQVLAGIALPISHMLTTAAGIDLMVYLGSWFKGNVPKGQWHQFSILANTKDSFELIPPYLVVSLIALLVIRLRIRADSKFNATVSEPGLPNPPLNSDPTATVC